jgi:Leucine-rich repeat (LRR) protein
MPRPDATDKVRAPVEIVHGGRAHHRQASLQICQILPAEHLVRRSGTPGHARKWYHDKANERRTVARVSGGCWCGRCFANNRIVSGLPPFGSYRIPAFFRRDSIRVVAEPSPSHLSLWKKQLGHVPESVWEQVELETLVLADNGLREVSAKIGRLKRLRMLDLGHNALTQVPDTLGDLDGLTDFLYLHDNRLTSLPSSFDQLKKLRYLNLSENAFATLPDVVCGLANLIELRASDNQLTRLPDSVGQLSRLRELYLRNNKLTVLPESIGALLQLRQIDLRGNPLTRLPATMATLPRLEKLDLRWVSTLVRPAWISDLEAHGCVVYS